MSIFSAFSKKDPEQENSASEGEQSGEKTPSEQSITRVPWGPVGATLVAFVAVFVAEVAGFLLVAGFLWISGNVSLQSAQTVIGQNLPLLFIAYGGARLLALGVVYWFVRRRGGGWKSLGFKSFRVSQAAFVVVIGFIGFLAVAATATAVLQHVAPGVDITAEQNIPFLEAKNAGEIVLAFLALIVIAPIAEETIFRGLLLPAFGKIIGVLPAVLLISAGFGVLHPPVNAMVVIGAFSLFLCWAYIKTKSIWPAIMLHAAKNLIAFLTLGIINV